MNSILAVHRTAAAGSNCADYITAPPRPVTLFVRRQEGNDDHDVPHRSPRRRALRLRPALSGATSRLRPDPSRLTTLVPADRVGRNGRAVAAGTVALPGARGNCWPRGPQGGDPDLAVRWAESARHLGSEARRPHPSAR